MPSQASKPPSLPPNAALRYDTVSRHLDRLRPATILEIGCGLGAFGARLATRADYLAIEPDETSWRTASSRIEPAGGRTLNVDHTGVPAGAQYDLVCAFEVLEHIEDDKAALRDWVDLIRPGGHLMLSVPAFQERFAPWDELAGHYRRYSPEQISSRAREAGLVDPVVTVYGWPLGYALEAVRNRVARKHSDTFSESSYEERTAGSGRVLQPKKLMGMAFRAGIVPFKYLQRLRPTKGTALVIVAARPEG